MLLTRDEFRKEVFKRDNHRCVICGLKEGERRIAYLPPMMLHLLKWYLCIPGPFPTFPQ